MNEQYAIEGTQMSAEGIEQLLETLDEVEAIVITERVSAAGDYDALVTIPDSGIARGVLNGFITQTSIFKLEAANDAEAEPLAHYHPWE